jgi:hypothetical protein
VAYGVEDIALISILVRNMARHLRHLIQESFLGQY